MSFADYPLYEQSRVYAVQTAIEESKLHPDHFIRIYQNSQGSYRIDYMGIKRADDERFLFSYLNGDRTL